MKLTKKDWERIRGCLKRELLFHYEGYGDARSRRANELKRTLRRVSRRNIAEQEYEQAEYIRMLEREIATAKRQMQETVQVNHVNAAAHRATEVAMLRQNHALQAAERMLSGKSVDRELTDAAREGKQLSVTMASPAPTLPAPTETSQLDTPHPSK